jgi:hypothetical protein
MSDQEKIDQLEKENTELKKRIKEDAARFQFYVRGYRQLMESVHELGEYYRKSIAKLVKKIGFPTKEEA